ACHFPPKPPRRFEPAAAGSIRKFHLGHDKTCMSAAINIDFDHNLVPWHFVTDLPQSSAGGTRPQRCELFRAQLDFAYFTMAAPTNLKREGRSVARLSQTNLSTSRLSCQITLLDNNVSRPLQLVWQPFDQKFSFNFAIVSPSIVPFHKLDILNAICSVSRFSLG